MVRVILGSLAAAVAMLVIGFIFFATPLARLGMGSLDDARAAAVQQALAANLPETGTYAVPGTDTQAQTNMYSQGPVATVHYNTGGFAAADPTMFLGGLIFNFVVALLIGAALIGLLALLSTLLVSLQVINPNRFALNADQLNYQLSTFFNAWDGLEDPRDSYSAEAIAKHESSAAPAAPAPEPAPTPESTAAVATVILVVLPVDHNEEAFDLMRGGHGLPRRLDRTGVSVIFLQLIKVDQMPGGAIQKKAEELLEERRHRKTFTALADRAEEAIEVPHQIQSAQVADENGQPQDAVPYVRIPVHRARRVRGGRR